MNTLRGKVFRLHRISESACKRLYWRARRHIPGTEEWKETEPADRRYLPTDWTTEESFLLFEEERKIWGRCRNHRDMVAGAFAELATDLEEAMAAARKIPVGKLGDDSDVALRVVFKELDRLHLSTIDYKLLGHYLELGLDYSEVEDITDALPDAAVEMGVEDWEVVSRGEFSLAELERRMKTADRSFNAKLHGELKRRGMETLLRASDRPLSEQEQAWVTELGDDDAILDLFEAHDEQHGMLTSFSSEQAPLYQAAALGLIGGMTPEDLGLPDPKQDADEWCLPKRALNIPPRELPCFATTAYRLNNFLRHWLKDQQRRDANILALFNAWFPVWFARKGDPVQVKDGELVKKGKRKPGRKKQQ